MLLLMFYPTTINSAGIPGDIVALTRADFSDLLALAILTEDFQLQPRTVFIAAAGG